MGQLNLDPVPVELGFILPAQRKKLGLPKKIPYSDYERLVVGWLAR